jgi:DNA helicase-2/ATP-dependent DNA helicase PcrA
MEENLFPSQRPGEKHSEDALEEERRLFYVALTRAEENAWFSYANQRYRWGNLDFCTPSRFLEEIDERFIDDNSFLIFQQKSVPHFKKPMETRQSVFNRRDSFESFASGNTRKLMGKKLVELNNSMEKQADFTGDDPTKIQSGMMVEHQRFGEGKVLKVEGAMPNLKATIFFQNYGQKQLLLKFAKLKIKV